MTIQEIAKNYYASLSEASKQYIASYPKKDIQILHYGLGNSIREMYLQDKPKPEDAASLSKEAISMEIIRAVWTIANSESEKTD